HPRLTPTSLSHSSRDHRDLHSFPTRRSSDLADQDQRRRGGCRGDGLHQRREEQGAQKQDPDHDTGEAGTPAHGNTRSALDVTRRSEEHTSELQSPYDLVCRLLLEKKKKQNKT